MPRHRAAEIFPGPHDRSLFSILPGARNAKAVNRAMIHIDHITAALEIEALAPEWRALWRRTPNATPFQSPEWLLSWWGCFGNAAPSVVTARDDDRLIGLLPLYLLDEPGCRKLLPFGISLSDYLDGLIDPGYAELGNRL